MAGGWFGGSPGLRRGTRAQFWRCFSYVRNPRAAGMGSVLLLHRLLCASGGLSSAKNAGDNAGPSTAPLAMRLRETPLRMAALRTCQRIRGQRPHGSRGRAWPGERKLQGVAVCCTLYTAPLPHPVSVGKFLVFSGLRQGFRANLLIRNELFAEYRR